MGFGYEINPLVRRKQTSGVYQATSVMCQKVTSDIMRGCATGLRDGLAFIEGRDLDLKTKSPYREDHDERLNRSILGCNQ
jgi:hypothetical protein